MTKRAKEQTTPPPPDTIREEMLGLARQIADAHRAGQPILPHIWRLCHARSREQDQERNPPTP